MDCEREGDKVSERSTTGRRARERERARWRTLRIASYGSSMAPYLPPAADSPYPWSSNGSRSGSSSTVSYRGAGTLADAALRP